MKQAKEIHKDSKIFVSNTPARSLTHAHTRATVHMAAITVMCANGAHAVMSATRPDLM